MGKTLANCTPTEFVAQTVKIKKHAERWLKLTKIMNIRGTQPQYKSLEKGASAEERADVIRENARIRQAQGVANLSRIFDACFEENPKETLELMALCCFVEPEHVDDHPISFYLKSMQELVSDEDVIGFFTSLVSLVQTNTARA